CRLRYETIPISEVNPKDLQKTVTSFKVVEEQLQGDRNEEELEDEENEENEENEPVQGKEKVKENHLSIALESSSEPADSMEGTGGSIETLDLGHAPRANRSQVDSPNSRSLRTILSQTNDHLVEEEAQRKEKMDQFMKSFANKSQVQGERTTLKKMDPEDERNDALDCPDCHGNRVCDKRTKMCRIPCGPGYPVCPLSESCLKTGFCSKVNEWLLETARPAVRVNQEYSENHDYADQEDGTTEGNSTYLEPLKDQTRLSERKIMPIIQNGLDRLKTSLKIVFQDMIEEFGLSSMFVRRGKAVMAPFLLMFLLLMMDIVSAFSQPKGEDGIIFGDPRETRAKTARRLSLANENADTSNESSSFENAEQQSGHFGFENRPRRVRQKTIFSAKARKNYGNSKEDSEEQLFVDPLKSRDRGGFGDKLQRAFNEISLVQLRPRPISFDTKRFVQALTRKLVDSIQALELSDFIRINGGLIKRTLANVALNALKRSANDDSRNIIRDPLRRFSFRHRDNRGIDRSI
ncbi:hypothetical protein TCAL_09215, partial [Tigriopus californicus]